MRYRTVFGYDSSHPVYTITLTEALRIGYSFLLKYPQAGVQIRKPKSTHPHDYIMFRDYIGAKPRTFMQDDKGRYYLVNYSGIRYKRAYGVVGQSHHGRKMFYTTKKPEKR